MFQRLGSGQFLDPAFGLTPEQVGQMFWARRFPDWASKSRFTTAAGERKRAGSQARKAEIPERRVSSQ